MTRTVTARQASDILNDLSGRLEATDDLTEAYAREILQLAQSNASHRPTPQAPMAAQAMGVQEGTILSLTGGDPAEVAGGSEFGSDIYLQFHRAHNDRGYWLLPAAESDSITAGDKWLTEQVEEAV